MGKPIGFGRYPERNRGKLTGGVETSSYPEEKTSKEIPVVAVSELGTAQTLLSSDDRGL